MGGGGGDISVDKPRTILGLTVSISEGSLCRASGILRCRRPVKFGKIREMSQYCQKSVDSHEIH